MKYISEVIEINFIGGTVIAAKANDFATIICCQPKIPGQYITPKVFKLHNYLCYTGTGISSDFSYIKQKIFSLLSNSIYTYGQEPSITRLVSSIATIYHDRTMSSGQRPLGLRSIIMGYDDISNVKIFEIDPFGNTYDCHVCFSG